MENRSRLPGEPSLDHPGVPTGRGGHRAGMKPLCGISSRLFWCLPALPRKCSDSRVGASSPGKCRSPQTAPRLWRPYLGSIEPSRSPELLLDAFRASLTSPESCLLQLRPCVHPRLPGVTCDGSDRSLFLAPFGPRVRCPGAVTPATLAPSGPC